MPHARKMQRPRPAAAPVLSDKDERLIAAEAGVDVRTVQRAMQGRTKSRATRAAIVAAMVKHGRKDAADFIGGENA